jgi:hypothetical protein
VVDQDTETDTDTGFRRMLCLLRKEAYSHPELLRHLDINLQLASAVFKAAA